MFVAVISDTCSHLECVCIDPVSDACVCGNGRLTAVHKPGPSNLLSPLLPETKAELEDLMADIKKLANKIRSKLKSESRVLVRFQLRLSIKSELRARSRMQETWSALFKYQRSKNVNLRHCFDYHFLALYWESRNKTENGKLRSYVTASDISVSKICR